MELCTYVNDRVELIHQIFLTMKSSKIKAMVPDCLRECEANEIKALLLDELLGISKKRLLTIIKGTLCPTDTESSDFDDSDVEEVTRVSEDADERDIKENDKHEVNNITSENDKVLIISDSDTKDRKTDTDSDAAILYDDHSTNSSKQSQKLLEAGTNSNSEAAIIISDSDDFKKSDEKIKDSSEEDSENVFDDPEKSSWQSRWLNSSQIKRVLLTSKICSDIRKKKKKLKHVHLLEESKENTSFSENNKNEMDTCDTLNGSVTEYNNLIH